MNAQRDRTLLELEQRLARVGGKISAEEARSLIADDFVEFGSSGKVWSKAEIVAALPECPAGALKFEDFHVRSLGDCACLVTYRIGSTLRSSIWRRGGEGWQIIFHQGTRVP